MAIIWGVLDAVWLVHWFVYFGKFSMARFFSTHGVDLLGISFFGSLLLARLDLPAHSALGLGRFLGNSIHGIACRGILPRRARLLV